MNAVATITAKDLVTDGDEPRVRDLKLAEALGYAKPTKIRELIERNLEELATYGPCPRHGAMVGIGSGAQREAQEFHLNEAQALLVSMRAGTDKAVEVRRQLIQVFMAYRHGQLVPESRGALGGIVKSVVHKELMIALETLLPQMVDARLAEDRRVAVVDYVSITEILDKDYRVPQKGRRSIHGKVRRLTEKHFLKSGIPIKECARTGTDLYQIDKARSFIKEACGDMILSHISQIGGQSVLPFTGGGKRS